MNTTGEDEQLRDLTDPKPNASDHEGRRMNLSQEVKQKAKEAGFALVGITMTEKLTDLPYGWVRKITNLRPPTELMHNVKSIILLGLKENNRAFNLAISSPDWKG